MPTIVSRRARRSPTLDSRRVQRLGDRMLAALDIEDAELSILLTDDSGIAELNRVHRHKNHPTDVLAFPQHEPWPPSAFVPEPVLLGDVVISLDTAAKQAIARRRALFEEVQFLLAHGVLHLIGYDHANRVEKREMDSATKRLLRDSSA